MHAFAAKCHTHIEAASIKNAFRAEFDTGEKTDNIVIDYEGVLAIIPSREDKERKEETSVVQNTLPNRIRVIGGHSAQI